MMRARVRSSVGCGLLCLLLVAPVGMAAPRERPPERARDLAYGAALYEYYQGDAFAALTELAVAEQRGGIRGHGDHPALLRGGMLLAYGMTRQAKAIFDALLKDNLRPATRNLAWFYLAKIFYLERDFASASAALVAIDAPLLAVENPELHEEVLYMRSQIALAERNEEAYLTAFEALPPGSVWRPYLQYNHAVLPASAGVLGETLARLRAVVIDEAAPFGTAERLALQDRLHLSEASFLLDAGDNRAAMASFQNVRLAGPLSDQALFGYALATANEKEFGLSLQALVTLSERPLFNPWVQQVPYALGYLYERLDDQDRALQAYSEAAGRYRQLRDDLERILEGLGEDAILRTIAQARDEGGAVVLGDPSMPIDSYGRLRIRPADYNLAQRIASEAFQIGLRDLHELYLLRDRFRDWDQRLTTAEKALETRRGQASQTSEGAAGPQERLNGFGTRIEATRARLDALAADLQAQIAVAQQDLVALVAQDLQRQRTEVVGYLVASQEARARLIDTQYRAQQQARETPAQQPSQAATEAAESESEALQPSQTATKPVESEPGAPQPGEAEPPASQPRSEEGDR